MGFSHHLVVKRMIAAEWTVFDEFALLKQIHAPTSALQSPFEPAQVSEGESERAGADE